MCIRDSILAVRSRQKGEAALTSIRLETNHPDAGEVWDLDMSSFESVEAFAKRLHELDRLDAVIENASISTGSFDTAEGMEYSLMVNVVGTLLLAIRALPKLEASGRAFNTQTNLTIITSGLAFGWNMKNMVKNCQGDILEALSKKDKFSGYYQ